MLMRKAAEGMPGCETEGPNNQYESRAVELSIVEVLQRLSCSTQ